MNLKVYFTLLFIIASLSLAAQNKSINDVQSASAQFTITGKVINQKDKKLITNASVFINNTTIGSETNKAGKPAQGKGTGADGFSQNDTLLKSTINKLTAFSTKYPEEKVYLHLDKPGGYFLNDTVWYKAYTVAGNHQLSDLSGVLHVELINPKDSVIARQTLRLISGVAWSNIPLPRTLKQGSYRIRAYTNWMRNFPGSFYDQNIRIGGIAPVLSKPTAAKAPDVQFFPEAGQLVDGVRSRVAVKSVGTNGLGEDIKGEIEDNEGNVVADFATQHLGMGVFALVPEAGKSYKAKITIPGEAVFTVDLPRAQTTGYTLTIGNNEKDSLYIKVAVNEKTLSEQKDHIFYILAQNNNKVYYTSQGKLENLVYSAEVEKDRFPTGITQFTLFSQNGEPLAERISFIQGDDLMKLNISSANQTYATRQKVKIDINTTDSTNNPATGSFSVAVINETRNGADENSESTILNNLLLTSDLKGYIEQPNYYFTNNSEQKQADLDMLMLTQGYRRFEWKQVLSNDQPEPVYKPEQSLELAGVLKTSGGKAVANGKVTFVAVRDKSALDTTTDINGNFKFSDIDLPDTGKIVLQARNEHNGSNVAIYVKQHDYPAITKTINVDISDRSATVELTPEMKKNIVAYQAQLKEDSIENSRHLKGVVIKAKRLPKPDRYNNYGATLEYDADVKRLAAEFLNITDGLVYLIPGLKGGPHQFYEEGPVKVIIDGLVRKTDDLNFYSPQEVENIRLVSATGLTPPTLILTTKRYAGTDTTAAIKLKEVKINAIKTNNKPELTHSTNLNGPGNADQVIMSDKLEGCINLTDCLQGRVLGVTFGKDGTPYNTRAQGHLSGTPAMVLIVDGVLMSGSHLNNLNAHDIYSIEVLRSGGNLAIYGSNAPGGALIITTKRGTEGSDNNYMTSVAPAGLITYPFKGYHKAKTFYSPVYTHAKTDTDPLDLRSTIYWNPNVVTDKDGNASFEYFNADTKGTYRVVVEGIDDNGNLGRQVYRYKVE
ncbi:MAG TPA: TonB-dependent receptor plug domain-containing protein [Mucilaginibacter sp.]